VSYAKTQRPQLRPFPSRLIVTTMCIICIITACGMNSVFAMSASESTIITDTVFVESFQIQHPDPVGLEIDFVNGQPLSALEVTLHHDSPDLVIDSFSFVDSRVQYIGLKGALRTDSTVTIFVFQFTEEAVPAGRGLLGTLYFSYQYPIEARNTLVDTITVVNGLIEHATFFTDSDLHSHVPHFKHGLISSGNSCCVGTTGNIDGSQSELVDLGDLTELIDYLFITTGKVLICPEEANTDGSADGIVDLSDLTHLIGYLFINPGLVPLTPCQ
jgi:hypothetical protein